jgi:hypothetical protein
MNHLILVLILTSNITLWVCCRIDSRQSPCFPSPSKSSTAGDVWWQAVSFAFCLRFLLPKHRQPWHHILSPTVELWGRRITWHVIAMACLMSWQDERQLPPADTDFLHAWQCCLLQWPFLQTVLASIPFNFKKHFKLSRLHSSLNASLGSSLVCFTCFLFPSSLFLLYELLLDYDVLWSVLVWVAPLLSRLVVGWARLHAESQHAGTTRRQNSNLGFALCTAKGGQLEGTL